MRIAITYVSGMVLDDAIESWPDLPADGIDRVIAKTNSGDCEIANHSLYWCYRDGSDWVMGAGSIRYDPNPLTEICLHPDGSQTERHPWFLPDLSHRDVKLGHWWRGTSSPIKARPWP